MKAILITLLVLAFALVGVAQTGTPPPAGTPAPAAKGKGKGERHPEIRKALHHLQQAKMNLSKAAHDYGGHRVKAEGLIEQAIKELNEGLKFDREHEGKGKAKS